MKYWLPLLGLAAVMTVVLYATRSKATQLEVENGSPVAIELVTVRMPSGVLLRARNLAPGESRRFTLRPTKAGGLLIRWGFVGNPTPFEDFNSFLNPHQGGSLHFLIHAAGIAPVVTIGDKEAD